MTRTRVTAALLMAATALALSTGTAQAQDYPGTTVTTGAPICVGTVSASGALVANATVSLSFTCPTLSGVVDGIVNSTPIKLPDTTVVNRTATWNGVKLPADWETSAYHNITVTDAETGAVRGTARFYVNKNGRIGAEKDDLPRTGSNSTEDLAKAGIALLAVGGAVSYGVRKRRTAAPAA